MSVYLLVNTMNKNSKTLKTSEFVLFWRKTHFNDSDDEYVYYAIRLNKPTSKHLI